MNSKRNNPSQLSRELAASSHLFNELPRIPRRKAIAAGLAGAVGAAFGLVFIPGEAPAAPDGGPINPGYFGPQYYGGEEEGALHDVLESGLPFRFAGPEPPNKVRLFEEAYAKYMGTKFALGVSSGTGALDCAMTALGIGPGDEVILPAYTWWSDYTCVLHAGALPVFADIDDTLNMDPKDFARKITPRTKAVIPVHLLGGPCDMDPVMETAKKHGIAVLEDAAQCVGGSYRGKKLGGIGDVGIYSFQLNKMISSGEGGALVTNNPKIYEGAARFHHMGLLDKLFESRVGESRVEMIPGENFRMSEFTGAVLGAQLPKLDQMLAGLRSAFNTVHDGIKKIPGIQFRRQPDPDGDICHSIFLKMENKDMRDACISALSKKGLSARRMSGSVLLPIDPAVMNKVARHPNWPTFNSPEGRAIEYGPASCKQTTDTYDRFVQVRMGPKYTKSDTDRIIDAIREFYKKA